MTHLINRVFARIFSKKLRKWKDSLIANKDLFGSPVTDDTKLWRSYEPEIKHWLFELMRSAINKIMTAKTQIAVRKIKPIKITKKILIISRNHPSAETAAEACTESEKQYEEHHDLEVLRIEDEFDILDFFKRHNLSWNERDSESPFPFDGTREFYLHFTSWLNCVKTGEPTLIMRQGTVFRSPIPALRFKDVIVLGEIHSISSVSPPKKEIFYPKYHAEDAYCYAITPLGARKLIEATQREFIQGTDKFICKRHVDIIYYAERFHPVDFIHESSNLEINVESQETIWTSYSTDD